MIFDYIILIFVVVIFSVVILGIFTKKGRLLSTKSFFGGGQVIKDYGWLDDTSTINPLMKQSIQVLKYKKEDEVFYVLLVRDTTIASVQMIPVKLSEHVAQKLVTIFSDKTKL